MSIGYDAWRIRRAARLSLPMGVTKVALRRTRALASSRLYSRLIPRRQAMSSYDPNGQLWRPNMGIRFSPTSKSRPLYPNLDLQRFIHEAASAAARASVGTGPQPTVNNDGQSPSITYSGPAGGLNNTSLGKTPDEAVEKKAAVDTDTRNNETLATSHQIKLKEPPSTSLDYKLPSESFHKARKCIKGSPGSYWSHLMYRKTEEDGTFKNVKVHYCTSKHTMEWVCQKHFLGEKILGFDLEWSPGATRDAGARQNVSLIQLASPSRIALFHVALFPKDDFVSPSLRKIMEDPEVSKVGVAIKADCTRLGKFLGVDAQGIFELSHMYKQVKYVRERKPKLINKILVPLAAQVEECLGLPLYKGDTVRASDWTRSLNMRQITYSAADAYAGIQLYHVLDEQRQNLDPCPPRPFPLELKIPIPIPEEIIEEADSEPSAKTEDVEAENANDTSPAVEPSTKFSDKRVAEADTKMQKYRSAKRGPISVGPSALRAYYIWYENKDLNPEAIAKLLREPPLQTHTVTSYILNSVAGENLPYCKTRMKEEILCLLTSTAASSERYKSVIESCQDITAKDES